MSQRTRAAHGRTTKLYILAGTFLRCNLPTTGTFPCSDTELLHPKIPGCQRRGCTGVSETLTSVSLPARRNGRCPDLPSLSQRCLVPPAQALETQGQGQGHPESRLGEIELHRLSTLQPVVWQVKRCNLRSLSAKSFLQREMLTGFCQSRNREAVEDILVKLHNVAHPLCKHFHIKPPSCFGVKVCFLAEFSPVAQSVEVRFLAGASRPSIGIPNGL